MTSLALGPRRLALRSKIETGLTGQIGTYRFSNGTTAPAIALLPDPNYGNAYPPAGTAVQGTGLEVVLVTPQTTDQPILGGSANKDSWFIYLRSHKKGAVPYDAMIALQQALPILQVFPIPASEQAGMPETVRLTVSDFYAIER
jgi:hypothetical protein